MDKPLVSVLMVTHNREMYVKDGIEAILAQTFHDFELIIVDDASTDRTWEIIQQYVSNPKISVHRNAVNIREYPTRNLAASLAKGKYLKYCDAEDILYPHCLQIMVANMEFYPDAGMGMCREEDTRFINPTFFSPHEVYRYQYLHKTIMGRGLPDVMIRADAFHDSGGFDPRFRAADAHLWMKICKTRGFVLFVSGLAWGREHEGQATQVVLSSGLSELETLIWSQELFADSLCPLDPYERKLALENIKYRFIRTILRFARSGRLGQVRQLWQRSGLRVKEFLRIGYYLPHARSNHGGTTVKIPDWRSYSYTSFRDKAGQ